MLDSIYHKTELLKIIHFCLLGILSFAGSLVCCVFLYLYHFPYAP